MVSLIIRHASGDVESVAVRRSTLHREGPCTPELSRLVTEQIAYIDLTQISKNQFDSLMDVYSRRTALILDLRGHCGIGVDGIAARFIKGTFKYGERIIPQRMTPENNLRNDVVQSLFVSSGPEDTYTGILAILIGERSTAQSEEICMMLVAARKATTVGWLTPGNLGAITSAILPGNVTVFFTGADYRFPNGHSVSQMGIHPRVPARATIEGIRAGRDEVLDAAVEHLSGILDAK
jgi:C-terminal processing protease CtpA/Prc